MTPYLLCESPSPGVLLLTLNRPERKNALVHEMTNAFIDAIEASNDDPDIRAIVVTGAGGNYSSGGDLTEFQQLDLRTDPPVGQRMMEALNDATKPLIAAVEGLAVGGSATMLLHFDLVYAARSARFRLPFTHLGTCPEGASSYYLPLIAGYRKAAELLMLGEYFGVDTASEVGMVTQATADGEGPQHLLVALGYAGWGPGQLERELAENSWLFGPADFDILFHTRNDLRWLAAAALLGIDLNLLSADVGHA